MITFPIQSRSHSYPITIGRGLLPRVLELLDSLPGPAIVISDNNLQRCQRDWLDALRERAGGHSQCITAGEGSKNLAGLNAILDRMHRAGLERNSPVIAFGGGVVGDLAGLAASLWQRGAPLIQIPTSLLAMVDSSVGGKTGINFKGVKNLVGSFWPPRAVFADLDLLATLPREERICGFGEMLKAAWLSSEDRAALLEAQVDRLLELEPEALDESVVQAIRFKAAIVEQDEGDTTGRRALLNLGHTFGHALESLSGGELRHGQAVLLGIRAAVIAAGEMRVCEAMLCRRMIHRLDRLLKRLEIVLPDRCRQPGDLVARMRRDKKVEGGGHTLILPVRVGEARVVRLEDERVLHTVWQAMFAERTTG
jgi:3-dehydroquinate synthase